MTERIVCVKCGREGHHSSSFTKPALRDIALYAEAGRKGGLAKQQDLIGCLTVRQHQVLELVSKGMGDKAIGTALNISNETAKGHAQDACAAIGGINRAHACTMAVRMGLL